MESYEELKSQYAELLSVLYKVVTSVRTRQPPGADSRIEYDYFGFGLKILAHAVTILRLADPPGARTLAGRYKLIDFSSGMTLSRAMFEAYARFVYLFLAEPDGPERDLRHALWERSDLIERQRFPADAEWAKAKLEADARRIEVLRREIESNEAFRERRPDQQKRLLDEGRPVAVEPGFVGVGTIAGFYPPFLRSFYWLLCSHTHTGYLSVSQSFQAGSLEEQREMMRFDRAARKVTLSPLGN